jgi:asparagine synthase (glutamine-hydrolysing)
MCGIAGILSSKQDIRPEAIDNMVASQHHRGPDDTGIEEIPLGEARCWLGSSRLAIIDLSPAGHMPMVDRATGHWIVYNGEVYNFPEIRQELRVVGEEFLSSTDTEVLLKAYKRWGRDCVRRFRGMFAFGIWDNANHELFLARDRLGKKPLYYFQDHSGTFLFASEVRALLSSGYIERRLDRRTLEVYLFNGFVVSPLTIVRGIRSLLPGHWMRVGLNGQILENYCYWRPSRQPEGKNDQSVQVAEVRKHLEDSVRLRLVSDVPLGIFLSGGMDSSCITALASGSIGDVRTFSIGFKESGYDESLFARLVAEHFSTAHTEIRLRKEDFLRWLSDALASLDQPSFDGINTYCVARAAKESGLTVALSGLGSDEVFGGYPFFKTIPWLSKFALIMQRSPSVVTSWIERVLRHHGLHMSGFWKALELVCDQHKAQTHLIPLAAYQTAQLHYPKWSRQELLVDSSRLSDVQTWFGLPTEFVQFLEQDMSGGAQEGLTSLYALRLFLGERCLRDTDTMSMSVSLEVRAPFTDHLLIESISKIPSRIRCSGAPNKPFQWELVKSYLGEEYPLRKKKGFVFPFEVWLRDEIFTEQVMPLVTENRLAESIGLQADTIAAIARDFLQPNSTVPWSRIWSLFALLHWCRQNRVSL